MKILKILIIGIVFLTSINLNAQENWSPTKIFYVRHAQTVANETSVYNKKTMTTFSDLGSKQIHIIDTILQNYKFDKIVISPTWRTQNTVYPYLKSTNQKAEIWPELTECCWLKDKNSPPTVSTDSIPWGDEIVIIDSSYFYFKDTTANKDYYWDTKNYQDGVVQCRLAADSLKYKFGKKGLTILVVGHSIQGREMIKIMSDESVKLSNASLKFYLLEQKDGSFLVKDLKSLD